MDIKTSDGINIYCLPDGAICTLTNEEVMSMDECPCRNFDDFGDICVPELCEHYTER